MTLQAVLNELQALGQKAKDDVTNFQPSPAVLQAAGEGYSSAIEDEKDLHRKSVTIVQEMIQRTETSIMQSSSVGGHDDLCR